MIRQSLGEFQFQGHQYRLFAECDSVYEPYFQITEFYLDRRPETVQAWYDHALPWQSLNYGAMTTNTVDSLSYRVVERWRSGVIFNALRMLATFAQYGGTECIENGAFATDSDWTWGSDWSHDIEHALHNAGASTDPLIQAAASLAHPVFPGLTYEVVANVTKISGSGSGLKARLGTASTYYSTAGYLDATQTWTNQLICHPGTWGEAYEAARFAVVSTDDFGCYLDDVSVKMHPVEMTFTDPGPQFTNYLYGMWVQDAVSRYTVSKASVSSGQDAWVIHQDVKDASDSWGNYRVVQRYEADTLMNKVFTVAVT